MKYIFSILYTIINAGAFCQTKGVSINATGTPPDPSALLDLSSTTKGSLIPRMSKTQRDSINSPALGLQIYDTTTHCFEAYGFGNWQTLSCLCTGPPSAPGSITGNNSPCAHEANLVFSVPLVLNVTSYTWTVPADAVIIAGQGSNSITINFGVDTGSIKVTANNGCGASSASSEHVSIVTTPATPGSITGNAYPCANASAQSYSVAQVNGATSYTWSVPSGANIAFGQGTNSILVNFGSTQGNISVIASNGCGNSSASILAITMPSAAPNNPGTIHGDSTFTPNQTGVVYYIAPVSNANVYTWSVPADATITSGQGTDSITVTFGNNSGNICVTASNCVGSSSSCFTVHNSCYTPGSQTFSYTGAQQIFTVPCGVPWVTVAAFGAQGGNGGSNNNNNGGLGGTVTGTLNVTTGAVLNVYVGGQNGYNGGGSGGNGGGSSNHNGGGESDVRMGGTGTSNWIIVAGGGGGGAYAGGTGGAGGGGSVCVYGAGGGGGSSANIGSGSPGTCTSGGNAGTTFGSIAGGGGGGGLTGGGAGSSANGYGSSGGIGTQGVGGNDGSYVGGPGCTCNYGGAGGGGGYYGGGGTAQSCCEGGSGGGGSSWAASVMTNLIFSGGIQSGDGKVVITW